MRLRQLFCLLLVGCNTLPSQTSQRPYSVQFGASLHISSQSELDKRFRAPFEEGTAHPHGIQNCTELLVKHRATSPAERSTLANCVALAQLRQAAPARRSSMVGLKWNADVLPMLPPQLAISVSAEAIRAAKLAAARGQRWTDIDSTVKVKNDKPDQITITGEGFMSRLVLWGRGDFNRDGWEDLLVQSRDALTEGTYRNVRLYLLTRYKPNEGLQVVQQLL